jgi:TPR repeat protein
MRLAVMFTDGMGVARDELLAKEYLLKAENHGSSIARECIDLIVKSGLTIDEAIDKYRDRIS